MTARRTGAAVLLAGFLAASAFAAEGFRPIEVTAEPFAAFAVAGGDPKFGEIAFRGGLVLSSADRDFGALSGLSVGPDGSLLAVADNGFWFSGRLIEDAGRLAGIEETALAPILDSKGRLRRGKRAADAEALRVVDVKDGRTAVVAFEQMHEVSRFALGRDLAAAAARPMKLPDIARSLRPNAGIETLAVAPTPGPLAGATVLIAEHALDKNGNHRGWIVGGPRAGAFSVRRIGDFDITDGDFLPNGDLVILERFFNPAAGLAMRIRRLAAAELAPGRTAEGEIVLTAGLDEYRIDNMEGLSLRPEPDGSTSIFVVSDDNQSFLQQTILLKFSWPAGALE